MISRPLSSKLAPVFAAVALLAPEAVRADDSDEAPRVAPEDILKNIVVEASAEGGVEVPLPKIGVHPTLAFDESDITLRNVIRRDLQLSGEYELLPEPSDALLSDAKVDIEDWKKKGAEAVLKLDGKSSSDGKVTLDVTAWLTEEPEEPVFKRRVDTDLTQVRVEAHRLADGILKALTGTEGGFSSEMTFVFGHGKARRVYVIDSDGHDPRAVSPPEQLAIAPSFGPDHQLFWAGSVDRGPFKLYRTGLKEPIALFPKGSVYGIAYSRNEEQVAVSIARGSGIRLFKGPDLERLELAVDNDLAIHPAWSPNGRLAYVGDTKWGTRVYIDRQPVSPSGLTASAPVFCRHPTGIRAIFTVGFGKSMDIVATGENGGGLSRLTHGGTSRYPACSPDGRLVAFFSTGGLAEGPGLYIMRIDGSRAKRISTLVGDSLRWARVPVGKLTPIAASK